MHQARTQPSPARLVIAFSLVSLVLVTAMLGVFDPAKCWFFPKCQFHAFTRLECPGCGGQRAVHHLIHGEVAAAFRCNALVFLLVPVGGWWTAAYLTQQRGWQVLPWPFQHKIWLWALTGIIIGFGIVRNLPGAECLRP
jgi:hypothetical protein